MKNTLLIVCALSLAACARTEPAGDIGNNACMCPPERSVAERFVLENRDCKCDIALVARDTCNCLSTEEPFDVLSVTQGESCNYITIEQESIADCKCTVSVPEQSADLHTYTSNAVTWLGPKHAGGDPCGEPLACGPHCGCLSFHFTDHPSA